MEYNIDVEKTKMQLWVLRVMALTLGSVLSATVFVMLIGLFVPNTVIDNKEIFKILGPAFSMIVGAFVGSFATMMGMKTESFNPNAPKLQEVNDNPTPPAPPPAAASSVPSASKDDDDKEEAKPDHGPF